MPCHLFIGAAIQAFDLQPHHLMHHLNHPAGGAVEIIVNGETTTVTPQTVAALLETLGIDRRRVAVELNLDILPKAEYAATELRDGDRLEIVQFVGGG
jgi:sulfur carrier protein